MIRQTLGMLILLAVALGSAGQQADVSKALESQRQRNDRAFDDTQRAIDDALWYFKLGDVARIEKFEIASSKPRREKNPNDMNAGNAIILPVYVFAPKNLQGRAPTLIFAHGGVHGRLTSNYAHIFREGLERGFVIVSPEYRGSIGHGSDLYAQIDYGGAEIDDTHDARNWAVENLPYVDSSRVGIFGWSHGGFHALMNVLQWPADYRVAYAGVPVSDLVARMGYTGQGYRDTFADFMGGQPEDNIKEFRRRSPVFHAAKLQTPLLIHTTTNDEDVHVLEVEHLIAALRAEGKKFEYKVYENAPGAHRFNRIDTKLAKESRAEMWDFLARHLK
jgi:dipeptidyl aminopeptidase/acylaminoacyl peptidase